MQVLGYMAICLIFGTTYISIKTGMAAGSPPLQLASLRFLLAGFLMVGVGLFLRRPADDFGIRWRDVATASLLTTVIPFGVLFLAMPYITAAEAALLVASSAIFLCIFSPTSLGQKVGVGIATLGTLVLFWPELALGTGSASGWLAKAAIIAAELVYALGTVKLSRVLAKGTSLPLLNGLQMAFAGACFLVLSLALEGPSLPPLSLALGFSLLHLAVIGSVVGVGIYYWLLRSYGPFLPSTSVFVSPVVAAAAGAYWLGEAVTPSAFVAAALILLGMVGIYWQPLAGLIARRRQDPQPGPTGTDLQAPLPRTRARAWLRLRTGPAPFRGTN